MEGDGGGGGELVELEDAVKLLVEHLVRPVLPRGALKRESNLSPEKQETVARQVSSPGEAGVEKLARIFNVTSAARERMEAEIKYFH